jgi:hypothetical protein
VIGRHDRDGVDVAIFEKPAEVAERLGLVSADLFDPGDGPVDMSCVHVTDGPDANVRMFEELAETSASHPADAYHAEHDLVARLRLRQKRTADRRQRDARGGGFEKRASGHLHCGKL